MPILDFKLHPSSHSFKLREFKYVTNEQLGNSAKHAGNNDSSHTLFHLVIV